MIVSLDSDLRIKPPAVYGWRLESSGQSFTFQGELGEGCFATCDIPWRVVGSTSASIFASASV